jgi:hypothetical protein
MTLDEEIREKISLFPDKYKILNDWEEVADKLSDSFEWVGSKIKWSATKEHYSLGLSGDYSEWIPLISEFAEKVDRKYKIFHNNEIFYINDSSLDFSVALRAEVFFDFLKIAIENIPQHHYFFDENYRWCFVISSEGFVDFGFSNLVK